MSPLKLRLKPKELERVQGFVQGSTRFPERTSAHYTSAGQSPGSLASFQRYIFLQLCAIILRCQAMGGGANRCLIFNRSSARTSSRPKA